MLEKNKFNHQFIRYYLYNRRNSYIMYIKLTVFKLSLSFILLFNLLNNSNLSHDFTNENKSFNQYIDYNIMYTKIKNYRLRNNY